MLVPPATAEASRSLATGTPPAPAHGITASLRQCIGPDAWWKPAVTPPGATSLGARAAHAIRSVKQLLRPSRTPVAISPLPHDAPPEIFAEILGHLEASDAVNLAAVSKKLRDIVMQYRTPEISRQRSAALIRHAESAQDLKSMLSHLAHVSTRGSGDFKTRAFLDFLGTATASHLQNMRSLEICLQESLVLGYADPSDAPPRICSMLAKALNNFDTNLDATRLVPITVELDGGRFAGELALSGAAESAALVTQFIVGSIEKGSIEKRVGHRA